MRTGVSSEVLCNSRQKIETLKYRPALLGFRQLFNLFEHEFSDMKFMNASYSGKKCWFTTAMKKHLKILFIHQNFPCQFRSLAPSLAAAGHDVHALSMRPNPKLNGVSHLRYAPKRSSAVDIHPWLVNTEAAVIRAEAVAQEVDTLLRCGWCPDVVLGHTGWG
jgi:hypothetical protein